MDYINAFWVGGLICALVQILLEKTKMLPGRVMVLLVCTGAVLGSLGLYDKLIAFAGAGASVPLLGFGNTLFKGVKKAILENGFLGIFMGGFTASAVGISAALIFGYLASLIFRPKMKNRQRKSRQEYGCKNEKKDHLKRSEKENNMVKMYMKTEKNEKN